MEDTVPAAAQAHIYKEKPLSKVPSYSEKCMHGWWFTIIITTKAKTLSYLGLYQILPLLANTLLAITLSTLLIFNQKDHLSLVITPYSVSL